jgi:hypothetical protein
MKKILERIMGLKKELKTIQTKDKFEKLFIKHNILNLEVQEEDLGYFHESSKRNIEKATEKILGKNAIKRLERIIKEFDYKSHWEYYLSYEDYAFRSLPSDDPGIQEEFRKILESLKKDVVSYAEKHFGFPKEYQFDLVLGQPHSDRSCFNPTTNRLEISPSTFFVYKDENNQVQINIAQTIQTIFHELIGHALQSINSKQLPYTIQDTAINTEIISSNMHAEGIAQRTLEYAKEFIEENKVKYHIKEDYIKQITLWEKQLNSSAFGCYFQYLKIKEVENKKFNVEKELLMERLKLINQ